MIRYENISTSGEVVARVICCLNTSFYHFQTNPKPSDKIIQNDICVDTTEKMGLMAKKHILTFCHS